MKNLLYYKKLIETTTDAGHAAKSGTFRAWQAKCVNTRQALKQARADHDAELQELQGVYTTRIFLQKKAEIDEKFNSIVNDAKKKLTEDLDAVIESKRAQFDKCSGAPSAEDLRLLQALSMRTSLSVAEVSDVVGRLNGNVQSLSLLRDIAARHDIRIPIGATTREAFDEQLQRAREFSMDRLQRGLEVSDAELGYRDKLFYDYSDRGEARFFYDGLDDNILTSQQITRATKEPASPVVKAEQGTTTAGEDDQPGGAVEMWAEVKCNGSMSLSTIAGQFHVSKQQIRDANPGKDLDRIYTGDVILVPSTRFTFQPDPSGGHVQPSQVRAVPRPKVECPAGPNGEAIGDDISIL